MIRQRAKSDESLAEQSINAENHGGDNHEEQASEQRVTQGDGSPAEHERRAEMRV